MLKYLSSFKSIVVISLICLIPVVFSYGLSLKTLHASAWQMIQIKGETSFHLIQTMRLWNAGHGGVYAPVTVQTPVNPYLNVPEREIETPSGKTLTVVNPAYMTRQLGERLKDTQVEIHLTSLKPLNPNNQPDPWEREALLSFEQGEQKRMILSNGVYRYMQPLKVEPACMECHQSQGYQVGDIRGGLSISFPSDDINELLAGLRAEIIWAHQIAYVLLLLIALLVQVLIHKLTTKLQYANSRQDELNTLASTDELTQLANRRHLLASFFERYQTAETQNLPFSVLMIDIDYFKMVNDRYGHQMGDQVLKRFANELMKNLRDHDLSGRYGGEEFMVALNANIALASTVAERIRQAAEEISFYAEEAFTISVSIGIAERQFNQPKGPEDLIRMSDEALYQAKARGRNRFCVAIQNGSVIIND